eukprot:1160859-Pelagomonas_calceolata.AAC.13
MQDAPCSLVLLMSFPAPVLFSAPHVFPCICSCSGSKHHPTLRGKQVPHTAGHALSQFSSSKLAIPARKTYGRSFSTNDDEGGGPQITRLASDHTKMLHPGTFSIPKPGIFYFHVPP